MKIGIIGLAGAGKDTFASLLQDNFFERYGKRFTIDRFSGPLKRATALVFGHTFDLREFKEKQVSMYGKYQDLLAAFSKLENDLSLTTDEAYAAAVLYDQHIINRESLSPREFQQIVGTEVIRGVRDTAWVDRVARLKTDLIIPDVRFQNEAKIMDKLLFIFRDVPPVAPHPSEAYAQGIQTSIIHGGLPSGVEVIYNTGDLARLSQAAESSASYIAQGH